ARVRRPCLQCRPQPDLQGTGAAERLYRTDFAPAPARGEGGRRADRSGGADEIPTVADHKGSAIGGARVPQTRRGMDRCITNRGSETDRTSERSLQKIPGPNLASSTVCSAGVAVSPIFVASNQSRTRRYFEM